MKNVPSQKKFKIVIIVVEIGVAVDEVPYQGRHSTSIFYIPPTLLKSNGRFGAEGANLLW